MKIWKKLRKFWYSDQRPEHKYHTDFSLKEGESIKENYLELAKVFEVKTPKLSEGKVWKFHFEMAVEEEDE